MTAIRSRIVPLGTVLLVVLAASATHTAGQTPVPPPVQAAAGCYRVTVGDWINPPGIDVALFTIPAEIRLEAAPGERSGVAGEETWALHPPQGMRPGEWAIWQVRAAGDSVQLHWMTGYTGSTVDAAVQPEGLEGTLTGFTDVLSAGQPPRIRPFRATRISCGDPDAPRVPALTIEDVWGATPPLPSCYVPLSVDNEEPAGDPQSWGAVLLALDTIVFEAPLSPSTREGSMRPAIEGGAGYWRRRFPPDPRLTVLWDAQTSALSWLVSLRGDTLVGEVRTQRGPSTPDPSRRAGSPSLTFGRLDFRALRVDCG